MVCFQKLPLLIDNSQAAGKCPDSNMATGQNKAGITLVLPKIGIGFRVKRQERLCPFPAGAVPKEALVYRAEQDVAIEWQHQVNMSIGKPFATRDEFQLPLLQYSEAGLQLVDVNPAVYLKKAAPAIDRPGAEDAISGYLYQQFFPPEIDRITYRQRFPKKAEVALALRQLIG